MIIQPARILRLGEAIAIAFVVAVDVISLYCSPVILFKDEATRNCFHQVRVGGSSSTR